MTALGFSGTQIGCTPEQLATLEVFMRSQQISVLHQGDCVGADKEAADIARKLGIRIVSHPPVDQSKRAFAEADEILEPLPYIKRNHAIVDACKVFVACPKMFEEELRSGTWSTIRYARKKGVHAMIVWPDGMLMPADVSRVVRK